MPRRRRLPASPCSRLRSPYRLWRTRRNRPITTNPREDLDDLSTQCPFCRRRRGRRARFREPGLGADLQPRHRQAGLLHLFGRRGHRQGRRRRRPEPARQAVRRHQRLCAGRQCRRAAVRSRQRAGDALRRHRHGHLQGQAAAEPARGGGPHAALFGILRAPRIRRSSPSPISRASACRAITPASACSTCSPRARWPMAA